MKRRPLEQIAPGAFVGRPVVDEKGRVLLNAGVKLTDRYLSTLANKGFKHLFVREIAPPLSESNIVSTAARSHVTAAEAVTRAFSTVHRELGGSEEKSLSEHRAWCTAHAADELVDAGGPIERVFSAADALLADLENAERALGPIVQHVHEGSVGEHAARVAAHCIALGDACGLDPRGLRQLAGGALLHDIGKAFAVPDPSSNAAIVYHTTLGFELLRASDSEDRLAPYVAYEHHEYQDGSGLPRGLIGSNRIARDRTAPPVPTLVGEIAAIANAYDRLVADDGSRPLPPDWALNVIRGHAGMRYNEELVRLFQREVTPYPIGEDVVVDSGPYEGYTAVVWAINPRYASKPMVMVYLDSAGKPCDPVELDLLNDSRLSIRGAAYH